MPSYTPEHYFGAVHDANGRWTGQHGLVPWPEHLKPRQTEPLPDIDLPTLFGDPSGVELTKKGEAYAEKALAEAGGVFFVTLSQDDRAGIVTTIERLIGLLDEMDGDENLEPYLSGYHDLDGDREADGDDIEPDNDEEYSLGWQDEGNQGHLQCAGFGDGDLEADLGTTEEIDQVRRLETAGGVMAGLDEPCLGWAESAGRGIVGQQNCLDDREHEDEREDDPAELGIADDDAKHSEEFIFGGWPGDGSGVMIARNMLRKMNGQPPLVEKAEAKPDGTVMRRFEPRDDAMIPELDLLAHCRAATERPQ